MSQGLRKSCNLFINHCCILKVLNALWKAWHSFCNYILILQGQQLICVKLCTEETEFQLKTELFLWIILFAGGKKQMRTYKISLNDCFWIIFMLIVYRVQVEESPTIWIINSRAGVACKWNVNLESPIFSKIWCILLPKRQCQQTRTKNKHLFISWVWIQSIFCYFCLLLVSCSFMKGKAHKMGLLAVQPTNLFRRHLNECFCYVQKPMTIPFFKGRKEMRSLHTPSYQASALQRADQC